MDYGLLQPRSRFWKWKLSNYSQFLSFQYDTIPACVKTSWNVKTSKRTPETRIQEPSMHVNERNQKHFHSKFIVLQQTELWSQQLHLSFSEEGAHCLHWWVEFFWIFINFWANRTANAVIYLIFRICIYVAVYTLITESRSKFFASTRVDIESTCLIQSYIVIGSAIRNFSSLR